MTHDPEYIDDGAWVLLGLLFAAAIAFFIWLLWDGGLLLPLLYIILVIVLGILGLIALMYALGWIANEVPPRIRGWLGR